MDRRIETFDIETLASCFTYTGYNIDTKEVKQFVIHESRNDIVAMVNHIRSLKGMVGFNNLMFDYPIIHFIIKNMDDWFYDGLSNEEMINLIYNKAQEIINSQNTDNRYGFMIKSRDMFVSQMDLFKMHHFDNKARRTSLKSLEISMNYPNVMDMPIHHGRTDIKEEEIPEILDYNLNDVMATEKLRLLSLDKIKLRLDLIAKYELDCINYPDSKIGEELVLKLYSDSIGANKWDIKKLRTINSKIKLKDCIFDYIKFNSKEFNLILNSFKCKIIDGTKDDEESVIYKGFKYVYGLGGIHGCISPGVYESDDKYIIIDADVASLYPSIAVINSLYPAHLGPEFCLVYKNILDQRIAAKKAKNMTLSDGLKLSLNSVYGKSNDKYSFLFDSIYTMKTTLNGQFMLTMLIEELVSNIDDLTMLQVNTDGITVKILRSDYDKYLKICKSWEKLTKLELEYVEYSKMIIRDVNNYMSISTSGKIKYKGAFEIVKDLHKDNSDKIVAIAISDYFIKGISVEQTIRNHDNIYDFCGRQKFIGEDYGVTHTLDYKDGEAYERIEKQQKNVRYYITNKGASFIKHYSTGGTEVINKGYQVKIFNKFEEKSMKDYDINYNYYITEAYKIINTTENKQLKLF